MFSRLIPQNILWNNSYSIIWHDLKMSASLFLQNPNAWAIMGHVKYLQEDMEIAKDCYERTLAFTADASETHSIYLRLASIYLQEARVRRVDHCRHKRALTVS